MTLKSKANLLTCRALHTHTHAHRHTLCVYLYFFLSILLIMALTSTGAEAAAALAFSSSSCCQRMMGWMPGFRLRAFCSSWASLGCKKKYLIDGKASFPSDRRYTVHISVGFMTQSMEYLYKYPTVTQKCHDHGEKHQAHTYYACIYIEIDTIKIDTSLLVQDQITNLKL